MSTSEQLPILLIFDRNYWAPAYTVMRSICVHSRRLPDLIFHLAYLDLEPWQIADLENIREEFGVTLVFHDISANDRFAAIQAQLKTNKRFGVFVYARMLIHEFVGPGPRRALYLDCDIMVRAPIENLFGLDMGGNPIAAAADVGGWVFTAGRELRENPSNLALSDGYFNSGVLLIDLELWRQEQVWTQFSQIVQSGQLQNMYFDQDVLNLIFKRRWASLEWRWNVLDPSEQLAPTNPYILHYTGYKKPWLLRSNVGFARLYRHTMTNELFYRYFRFRMRSRLRRLLPWTQARK